MHGADLPQSPNPDPGTFPTSSWQTAPVESHPLTHFNVLTGFSIGPSTTGGSLDGDIRSQKPSANNDQARVEKAKGLESRQSLAWA